MSDEPMQVLDLIDEIDGDRSTFVLDRKLDLPVMVEVRDALDKYRKSVRNGDFSMDRVSGKVREIVEKHGYVVNCYYHDELVF